MAELTINVTQLKCACQDEKWRERWLRGENPPTFSLPGKSSQPVHGLRFHQIVDEFVNWLFHFPKDQKNIPFSYNDLWLTLWEQSAGTHVNQLLEGNHNPDTVAHLVKCLKTFCHNLETLQNEVQDFNHWNQIFIVQEFKIENVVLEFEEGILRVSGRVDAIRSLPNHELEVVDYKLTKGENREQDLLQVAIYSQLLKLTKPGLSFHGLIEYYNPELETMKVDLTELDELYNTKVVPTIRYLLTEHPKKPEPTSGKKEEADTVPNPPKEEMAYIELLSHKIKDCYSSFKIDVDVIGAIEAPQLIRFQLKPGSGVKSVSLAGRADDLMVQLELPQAPHVHPQQGYVAVDIPKENSETVNLLDVLNKPEFQESDSPLVFPIGIGINNKLILADLAETNTCHALVAGMTGSGKSEFLKSMIYSLIKRNTQSAIQFILIDPKILSFNVFESIPHLSKPIITNIEEAIESLQEAVVEMNRRYQQLSDEKYDQLKDRFSDGKTDIPFLVIFVDEFGDLILSDKDQKKEFESLIAKIAQKGRAAGIHLVLATQRPEAKIVTGLIKANLPLKICMRVNTQKNSEIILDQSGGQNLLGKGDLLCDLGNETVRAQAPFIQTEALKDLLATASTVSN